MTKLEEKRKKEYPDTPCFKWYNANPKGKLTTDCVARALTLATGLTYEETITLMLEQTLKSGYFLNDKLNYSKILASFGFEKMSQPKRSDGTKVTGCEFVIMLNSNDIVVAHIGTHHVVAIINNKIHDTWDSSDGKIGNYWIKKGK